MTKYEYVITNISVHYINKIILYEYNYEIMLYQINQINNYRIILNITIWV